MALHRRQWDAELPEVANLRTRNAGTKPGRYPMVLVRMTFQAKMGCANQVVAGFKQGIDVMRAANPGLRRVRVLTDLSGPFDTVVQEMEFDSLEDFMRGQAAIFSDPRWQKLMQENQARDLVIGGSKEYFTIEYEA